MLKYLNTQVTFSEVPNEISLCINITNCLYSCKGCHSPQLRLDIGSKLNIDILDRLIKANEGITCVCFLGGDIDIDELNSLAKFAQEQHLKVCWYTGNAVIPNTINRDYFDYIKYGPYIEKFGPLNSKTTNQKFLKKEGTNWIDITNMFHKVGE